MNLKLLLLRLSTSASILAAVDPVLSQPWSPTSAPVGAWVTVTSSADGTKLAAAIPANYDSSIGFNKGGLYTSTDSGATWISNNIPCQPWVSLACSTNGSRLYAAAGSSSFACPIFCSTDWGSTWVATGAPSNSLQHAYWQSIACSADGTRVVAATSTGYLCTSTDSGTNWTAAGYGSYPWSAVASSADGTQFVAAARGSYGGIYISHNSGVTWVQTSAPRNQPWRSIASSADGTRLAAVAGGGAAGGTIYTSADSGATWANVNAPGLQWTSISSSADGAKLLAAATYSTAGGSPGLIYSTSDFGSTWVSTGAPNTNWVAVAASADWRQWVAASWRTISIWQAPPVLSIAASPSDVLISWPSGSSALNYQLQQTSELAAPNWAMVTNEPTVVDGQAQVRLGVSASHCFYRLMAP